MDKIISDIISKYSSDSTFYKTPSDLEYVTALDNISLTEIDIEQYYHNDAYIDYENSWNDELKFIQSINDQCFTVGKTDYYTNVSISGECRNNLDHYRRKLVMDGVLSVASPISVVGCVILSDTNEVLIVERSSNTDIYPGKLSECPSGYIDYRHDSPIACFNEEFTEEIYQDRDHTIQLDPYYVGFGIDLYNLSPNINAAVCLSKSDLPDDIDDNYEFSNYKIIGFDEFEDIPYTEFTPGGYYSIRRGIELYRNGNIE